MLIPFASIEIAGNLPFLNRLPFTEIQSANVSVGETIGETYIVQETAEKSSYTDVLFILYFIVAAALLIRFAVNIIRLLALANKNQQIKINNIKIVLIKDAFVPLSFGKYVFLNQDEYRNGQVENEVLAHEMTHIKQRHSLDIIFIELLLILFWFNPILYIYKKKIKLNHEFLADEGVISAYNDVPHYQMILIDKISRQCSLSLTSNLNYLLTKKRLTMMTKTTSTRIAVIKRMIVLPLFLIFAFAFCTKKVNEQANPDGKEKQILKEDAADIKAADTIAITSPQKEEDRVALTHFKPPIIKEEKMAPPPPPIPVKTEKDTKTSESDPVIMISVEDVKEEKKTPPPPPPVKKADEEIKVVISGGQSKDGPDLSSYKVGDKYIDSDGHEWIVESINPPKFKTNPPK